MPAPSPRSLIAAVVACTAGAACTEFHSTGHSGYGDVPVHWRGSVGGCHGPRVTEGDAFHVSLGYLEAVKEGRVAVACEDGRTIDVGARDPAVVTITGSQHLTSDDLHRYYELHVFAADGHELALGDMEGPDIAWTTTSGTIGTRPRGDMPLSAWRRLEVAELEPGPGTDPITITGTFAGVRGSLVISR